MLITGTGRSFSRQTPGASGSESGPGAAAWARSPIDRFILAKLEEKARSVAGADLNLAWPSAEIAVMGPKGAVEILFRKEIDESADPQAANRIVLVTGHYDSRNGDTFDAAGIAPGIPPSINADAMAGRKLPVVAVEVEARELVAAEHGATYENIDPSNEVVLGVAADHFGLNRQC